MFRRTQVFDCLNCLGTGKNYINPIWNDEPILERCNGCEGQGFVTKAVLKKQIKKSDDNNLRIAEIAGSPRTVPIPVKGKRDKKKS